MRKRAWCRRIAALGLCVGLATSTMVTIPALAETVNVGTGQTYTSINDAITAEKYEITLYNDITEDVVIPTGKTVTINLNGHKITNSAGHTITNNGTLTITGTGTVDNVSNGKAAIVNMPGGTVELNGGSVTRSKEDGKSNTHYTINNLGSMTINGGTVTNNSGFSSMIKNGWYSASSTTPTGNDPAAHTDDAVAELTINSGSFSGGFNTIKNDDYGKVTINGGTFENVAQNVVLNNNTATITGGTFKSEKGVDVFNRQIGNGNAGTLEISGGTFKGGITNEGEAELTISGDTEIGGNIKQETPDKQTKVKLNGGTIGGSIEMSGDFTATAGTVNGNVTNSSTSGKTKISGGTYNGKVTAANEEGLDVTGGIYDEELNEGLKLNTEYTQMELGNGDFEVVLDKDLFIDIKDKKEYTIGIGGAAQLTAETTPAKAKVTWAVASDSDATSNDIISVDQTGKVTGKSEGTASVYAKIKAVNGTTKIAEATITVSEYAIALKTPRLVIGEGKTGQIEADLPAGKDDVESPADAIKYDSDDEEIASVDQNGKVTGKADGQTTITLTASGSNAIDPAEASVIVAGKLDTESTEVSLKKGADDEVIWVTNRSLEALLEAGLIKGSDIVWTSSNEAVVKVAGSESDIRDAVLTPVAAGSATVTVTVKGYESLYGTASIKVTVTEDSTDPTDPSDPTDSTEPSASASVTEKSLKAGESFQLGYNANFTPVKIVLGSKDPDVATIDENGKVTAKKAGTTQVGALLYYGEGADDYITVSCTVTVTAANSGSSTSGRTPTPAGSGSSSGVQGGSTVTKTPTAAGGQWIKDETGWWYDNTDGSYPFSCWSYLLWNGTYEWYHFQSSGYMNAGWFTDTDGNRYFLHNVADGTQGHMYTGWHQIDGTWYYFRENAGGPMGSLVTNGTTPDGYRVDANGAWIQ